MRALLFLFLAGIAGVEWPRLELGKPVERRIEQGEIHTYRVGLSSGQYLRISLDQRRISLAARLIFPDGRPAVVVENTDIQEPPVPLPVIATMTGTYSLEVHLREKAAAGMYSVEIQELRASTAADQKRIAGESAYREGFDIVAPETKETRLAALAKFEQARSLWHEAGDLAREAQAVKKIGWVYFRGGESPKAIQAYEEVVALAHRIPDRLLEAEMLNNLGLERANGGDYAGALPDLERAAATMRELHVGRLSSPVHNVGFVYLKTGDIPKALEYLGQALEMRRHDGDERGEAATLSNMALAYSYQGLYQKALDTDEQALALWSAHGDRQRESLALHNIAALYLKLGDPQLALDRLERVLALKRALGDRSGEQHALLSMAGAYDQLGRQKKAAECYRASLAIAADLGNKPEQAKVLAGLGSALERSGQLGEALDRLAEARSLASAAGDRYVHAQAIIGAAGIYLRQAKPAEALPLAEEALSLARSGGLRDQEQSALVAAAQAEADLGNLDRARERIEAAIELAESARESVAGVDFRTTYFAGIRREYDLLIDVLMRLHRSHPGAGYDAQAFAVSEQARARSLIDSLGESRANIRAGADPALLAREQSVRAALNAKASAPDKDVQPLILEYREIANQIRAGSPHYAALTQPRSVTPNKIESEVLDGETLLLEYALGEKRSYVWAVTSRGLTGYELPPRAAIEAAARKAYAALSSQEAVAGGGAVEALSRLVLGPVSEKLGRKRVVIVSEGALQYIPFGALLDGSSQAMIAHHEVVALPSASTLAALRADAPGRKRAPLSVVAFGDPVFSADDARVARHAHAAPDESAATLERSAKDSGLTGLDRLWATRREAESVVALGGATGGRELVDFDASRKMALSGELGRYRIIHFATHGLLNTKHPEFSGLVLSLVDPEGKPVNGFLRAYEIYNLNLNADLVVLSACQTALGEDVKGEGLVGLTRGFMYAGAPRVVASLWKVSDRATAELMKRLYRGVLSEHRRPAEALRAAQAAMRSEARWSAPYYWAGFVLQGDWN